MLIYRRPRARLARKQLALSIALSCALVVLTANAAAAAEPAAAADETSGPKTLGEITVTAE